MLAKHPKTGAPIRILRTETHCYRDAKTLVVLGEQEKNKRWSLYDTLAIGLSTVLSWSETVKPTFLCFTEATKEVLEYIRSGECREAKLCFFSRAVLEAYGFERLMKERQNNILCLEECNDMYPYAGVRYTDESSSEQIAVQIARILRYGRLMCGKDGIARDELKLVSYQLPPELWLIQQYYKPSKSKRERELKTCLQRNFRNPYIDRIVLLNESDMSGEFEFGNKVHQEVIGRRLKYADVIRWIAESAPQNTICVFANSDIYLDETLKQLWSLNLDDKFLSLLRYEEPTEPGAEPELFGPRPDSQDTWILTSDSVKKRVWDYKSLDFEFGRAGCDNVINVEMLKQKYVVCNPALSLRTHHVHASGIRGYDPTDCLERPMYLYVDPTGLHDLEVKKDLSAFKSSKETVEPQEFSRRIHGDEKRLRIFCTMLKRKGFEYKVDSDNLWKSEATVTHTFQKAFQTLNGLVYGYNSIFVGDDKTLKEAWANEKLNPMVPCIHTESSVAVRLSEEVIQNPLLYILKYLGSILSVGVKGDFWMPKGDSRLDKFLRLFKWEGKQIPVVPYDEEGNLQIYSDTVHMVKSSDLVTKEVVEALRSRLLEAPEKRGKQAVIFQDSTLVTPKLLEILESKLVEQGWSISVVFLADTSPDVLAEKLGSASLCIGCSTELNQTELVYWMLPKECQVIELQNEMKLRGEGAHMAGACGLEYWVGLVERGVILEKLAGQILGWVEGSDTPMESSSAPKKLSLILPVNKDGYHGHAGDSFREMARLWAQKGYVNLEESSDEKFCWLEDTLLYDRPTYEWYDDAGLAVQKALVGNPAPREDGHKAWSFWPRKPELVEKLVAEGVPGNSWSERSKRIVFYGRVENAVQKAGRSGNWSTLCDEFVMPIGATASYGLSQEEYLKALSGSKFGLCLPGYGKKCHREVECMAMGCVPVVAPGVDMENYAVPPIEGVHYIRVQDALDARQKLDAISEERWALMSGACKAWWKANASCDGMWKLTSSLLN